MASTKEREFDIVIICQCKTTITWYGIGGRNNYQQNNS